MDELDVKDWRTAKKYINAGAPIRMVEGSWLTLRPLLAAWLVERLIEKGKPGGVP